MPRVNGRANMEDKLFEAQQRAKGFSEFHIAASMGDLRKVRSILKTSNVNLNFKETDLKFTPLCGAITSENVRVVEELIRAGADVNMNSGKNSDSAPLTLGVLSGKVEMVKVLLDNGADVHAVDPNLISALHVAADLGHVEISKLLIEHGAKLDACDDRNETPLHQAVQIGHTEVVRLLLAKGADVSATCTIARNGDKPDAQLNATALMLAVFQGHADVADVLIKAGIDVNAQTSEGCTALHFAAQNGPVKLVNMLLKAGAKCSINVPCRPPFNHTPLILAAKTGRVDNVKALLEVEGIEVDPKPGSMETPLWTAAALGRLEIVKLLIAKGAQVNGRALGTSTPLHSALGRKKDDVAEFLVENGADIHASDTVKDTPLHIACEEGSSLKIIRVLVELGANLDARGSEGKTPLQNAAKHDRLEIVKFLVNRGADLSAKDDHNFTALDHATMSGSVKTVVFLAPLMPLSLMMPQYIAVQMGHQKIFEFLISKSVNCSNQDFWNSKLLVVAVEKGLLEIAELLLRRNAPVNLKEATESCTPLFLAVKNKCDKLVCQLLDKGADPNTVNEFGVLPIHVAAKAESVGIVKALLTKGAYFNTEVHAENYSGTPLDFARDTGNAKFVAILELIEKLFSSVIENNVRQIGCCLQAGAIVNARDASGKTAVHYAVSNRNIDAVKALLSKNADITLVTKQGDLPLQIAVRNDSIDTAELLLAHAENLSFIKYNAAVNTETVESCVTPLLTAAENNNLQIVKLLLANGVVYNAINKLGKTPLQLASTAAIKNLLFSVEKLFEAVKKENGLEEVQQVLKDDDSAMNARESDGGCTPLFWSILKGHSDIANALLSRGANYCLVTNKGTTPLHIAASKGHVEIVEVLINRIKNDNAEQVANFVNAATKKGTVALHVASNAEIAKCLLQSGATYDIRNGNDKNALELAQNEDVRRLLRTIHKMFEDVKKGVSAVVKTLNGLEIEELKAIRGTRNVQGLSLVQVALTHSHVKIASQLIKRFR